MLGSFAVKIQVRFFSLFSLLFIFCFVLLFWFLFWIHTWIIFYFADLACFIHTRISSGYYKFLSGVLSNLIWHHILGLIIIIGIWISIPLWTWIWILCLGTFKLFSNW
jgi:hypothetical protein